MHTPHRGALCVAALAALVGCSSSSGQVKLGVDVASAQSAISVPVGSTGSSGATSTGLALTRVRLLVDHAKIGYTGGGASGADADVGPVVVDLTQAEIANGAHREFDLGSLDTGTYGGAEIEIQPPDAQDDPSNAALADFTSEGASLLVEGTLDGAAFTFAGHFLAEQGTDGDVTVDAATPVSLAMTVDPSTWFLDASGAPLAVTDASQHVAIADAICATLDTEANQSGPGGPGGGPGGQAHCAEASP